MASGSHFKSHCQQSFSFSCGVWDVAWEGSRMSMNLWQAVGERTSIADLTNLLLFLPRNITVSTQLLSGWNLLPHGREDFLLPVNNLRVPQGPEHSLLLC